MPDPAAKVALVTGAGRGIGREIAFRIAATLQSIIAHIYLGNTRHRRERLEQATTRRGWARLRVTASRGCASIPGRLAYPAKYSPDSPIGEQRRSQNPARRAFLENGG